ncbi:MAG: ankyrin repeat domain-containing protein [Candidatus Dormibacterales bacterium]
MSGQAVERTIPEGDAVAVELVAAIRAGDVEGLQRLLASDPSLARLRMAGRKGGTRSPLHVVADWPGYFPNGVQIVRLLVSAGADPNARDPKPRSETALHWAASSDDVDVAEALIDAGADIEVPDGSIGSPLANAVGYGCWHVARLLVARGASVEVPWIAAALGLVPRLTELLGNEPDPGKVSQSFWHACAAGQRRAAEYLLGRGADLNWVPDYAKGTPLDAAGGRGTRRENVITWLRELGAQPSEPV